MTELSLQLPRLPLQNKNFDVFAILHWAESGRLDLETPYQRGLVWGRTRQRNFIKSLLTGVPIPSLVFNDRLTANFAAPASYDRNRRNSRAVIDGKQRITAIIDFVNGEYGVPASWYSADAAPDAEVFYSDLPRPEQRKFENRTLPIVEGELPTIDAERELFDLVNFGGIPQGESDE